MTTKTLKLTWSDAVDQAMEPTDLDHKLTSGVFGMGKPRIGEDGKLQDYNFVRERAATAYIVAHEGEMARITYCDPKQVNERNRLVWIAVGELKRECVIYPTFDDLSVQQMERGFLVGHTVIPFAGVSSIRVEGDNSVVVL